MASDNKNIRQFPPTDFAAASFIDPFKEISRSKSKNKRAGNCTPGSLITTISLSRNRSTSSAIASISPSSTETSTLLRTDKQTGVAEQFYPFSTAFALEAGYIPLDSASPGSTSSSDDSDGGVALTPLTGETANIEQRTSLDGGVDTFGNSAIGTSKLCTQFDLFCWHTTLTSVPASIPFTYSPVSATRSASVEGSIHSFRPLEDLGEEWNVETLRDMTDVVRDALNRGSFPTQEMEVLSEILRVFLIDEQSTQRAPDLSIIIESRVDKCIEAINKTNSSIMADAPRFHEILMRASSLQHKWQARFKDKYFSIDNERIKDMKKMGALRDMTLNSAGWKNKQLWTVTDIQRSLLISAKEGDLGFQPGT